ncbi:MAG: hypothetical protein Q9162_003497 [Coniocarpon cinnabarinum]
MTKCVAQGTGKSEAEAKDLGMSLRPHEDPTADYVINQGVMKAVSKGCVAAVMGRILNHTLHYFSFTNHQADKFQSWPNDRSHYKASRSLLIQLWPGKIPNFHITANSETSSTRDTFQTLPTTTKTSFSIMPKGEQPPISQEMLDKQKQAQDSNAGQDNIDRSNVKKRLDKVDKEVQDSKGSSAMDKLKHPFGGGSKGKGGSS